MKCDKCTKKATVHLTEIVDGKVMEMHLCEDCAREQSQNMEQQFGLADLLAGLSDFGMHVPNTQPKSVLKCSVCGLTYEDFRKFGRFGCANCYEALKPQLKTLLKKIHGSNEHLGKKPVKESPALIKPKPVVDEVVPVKVPEEPEVETVETLRKKLHQAIEREDFEAAALLRDKIHELEGRG
ncbi:MAG: UvrB/UvrC motif-containing protein [Candidatus Omnitrophica bacterium]|nr:UvrB/UvrC motif-containing protein [Candidatus Omnitrophota bacterium]